MIGRLRGLFGPRGLFAGPPPIVTIAPKTSVVMDRKATNLLPRGAYGAAYGFFSSDGGRTLIDLSGIDSAALAFVAYWYCAVRWRAQKIAEAPLMVVQEDQVDGADEWLPEHELVEVLDAPSPDYDMGELLERTSRYLDNGAEALWVIDRDNATRIARITPFQKGEFEVKSSAERLFDHFVVNTSTGQRTKSFDEVCYFRDHCDGWTSGSRSRLDVAMSWLRLSEKARQTIRDLLENSIWPSGVIIPDKDWNPDPKTLEAYKLDIENYAQSGQKGRPFVQLGGGSFTPLSASIKDLVPTDVLNRVESVVAAVSGVPAIVLQFQVGMENSPWSQMAQARRMAYDDTIVPSWRRIERVLTRQLLRTVDEDTTHFIRFDKSKIESLQEDQQTAVEIATAMGRAATLNERRKKMGLEPATAKQDPDQKADLIPELSTPDLASLLTQRQPPTAPPSPPPTPETPPKEKFVQLLECKAKSIAMFESLRKDALATWQIAVHRLLVHDQKVIHEIVSTLLTDTVEKSAETKARNVQRVNSAVADYLAKEGRSAWMKTTLPLLTQSAERATALTAADLNVNYSILHPNAVRFAQKEAGQLLSSVTKTTKQLVADIVSAGLEEGRSTGEIAQLIQDAAGFSKARAVLIARTETTTVFNGAPIDALTEFSKSTNRQFVKTWLGVLDEKERDEHVAMEGETVPIDEPFSNGLDYPSEPNCRCTSLTHEVTDE